MIRLLIETGADFSANVGDEAYFAAMVDLFKARFGDGLEITKFANEPEKVAARYGIRALYTGYNLGRRLKALWPTLKAIARADLYVWGGGQMPLDSHGVLSVLYRFHRPILAKLLGRRVMAYAVGAGPLDLPHSRALVRWCMNLYDRITVRDRYSVQLLEEVGVRGPIEETVDSAIVLEASPAARVDEILAAEKVPLDRPLIAMVPWGPAFRRLKSAVPVIFRKEHFRPEDRRRLDEHCAVVAGALDGFIERREVFVVFVAMDRSKGHGFDDEVARRTIERMRHKDQARLIEGVYHPKEVKGLLGRCRFVAGSRMHGLILATGEAVPTVGICFTEKIRDFARLTGQDAYYANARDLTRPEDLEALFERCWTERGAASARLGPVLAGFAGKVRENVERLAGLVARPATNINEVRRARLCHFCGTCYGVCPRDNIRIDREWDGQPRFVAVRASRCVGCGLCYRLCPGRRVDFDQARMHAFGRLKAVSSLAGPYDRLLLTQSTRPEVQARATSGGTVAELLRHLLETRAVDGVVVTRMACEAGSRAGLREKGVGDPIVKVPHPIFPVTWVAREVGELAALHGSMYMSAPVNTVLRTIKAEGAGKRFAVVGLGCHIEGLRAAQRELPWLRERVTLAVGLFCGHGVRPAGTWHLLRRLGFAVGDVRDLAYRDGPMPGAFRASDRAGRVGRMPMRQYGYVLSAYGNWRCATCVDPLCELADVSVGDAWLPETRGRGDWNLTLVRTAAGAAAIDALVSRGRLRAEPTGEARLSQAQRMQLYQRERGAWARMRLLHALGFAVPAYRGVAPRALRKADYKRALLMLAVPALAQWRYTQGVMVLAARFAERLVHRTGKKDSLIGRDREYRREFFKGGEYKF